MAAMTFHPDGFRGRVYGVTGAAHGIGEATVRLLASLGANVLAIDKDEKNVARVKAEVKGRWVCADVGDEGEMRRAIEEVATTHGRFDGWVNNAMYAKRGMIDR